MVEGSTKGLERPLPPSISVSGTVTCRDPPLDGPLLSPILTHPSGALIAGS